MRYVLIGGMLALFCACGSAGSAEVGGSEADIIAAVAHSSSWQLEEFEAKPNPMGEGTFVYRPVSRYDDTAQHHIWLVLDGRAYPLNGPSKNATPGLPWPREVDQETWSRTGLDPHTPREAINIVFR